MSVIRGRPNLLDYSVFSVIAGEVRQSGHCTLSLRELGQRVGMSRQHVHQVLHRLEHKGMVTLSAAPYPSRALSITVVECPKILAPFVHTTPYLLACAEDEEGGIAAARVVIGNEEVVLIRAVQGEAISEMVLHPSAWNTFLAGALPVLERDIKDA